MPVANFSMCAEDETDGGTTATRMSDLRSDLEEKFSNMIQERFSVCNERINKIGDTVMAVKQEVTDMTNATHAIESSVSAVQADIAHVASTSAKEFDSIKAQNNESIHQQIQSSIQSSNTGLMQQMQSLFQQMKTDIQASIAAKDENAEGEPKRPKH